MADGDFVDYLVAHGAYAEAARAAAGRGELARAIALYERVWRFADAWPLALTLGDRALGVGGLIYERLIGQGTGKGGGEPASAEASDESTIARLALGRLLARLGRAEEAVRHLQIVARVPALRMAAWRALCGPLLALGL